MPSHSLQRVHRESRTQRACLHIARNFHFSSQPAPVSKQPMSSPQREGFAAPASISHAALGQVTNKSLGVKYNCAQCATSFSLGKSDAIRCKECGHRVIYKSRTRRVVQFEAR